LKLLYTVTILFFSIQSIAQKRIHEGPGSPLELWQKQFSNDVPKQKPNSRVPDLYSNFTNGATILETGTNCKTHTYKFEITGDQGIQLGLVATAAHTDNSVIIAGNEISRANKTSGVLVRLQPDGTIQQKTIFAIGTRSLKIDAMQIRNNQLVVIAGTFEDNKKQFFLASLNLDLQVQRCIVADTEEEISGLQMTAMHETGIFIACDVNNKQLVFGFNEKFEKNWAVSLGRLNNQICKGINVNGLDRLSIGRQTENNTITSGHILTLDAKTGYLQQSWSIPTDNGTGPMKHFTGFGDAIGWISVANDSMNNRKFVLKTTNMASNAGVANIYELPQNLDTAASALYSRAMDAVAIGNPVSGSLFLFQRHLLENVDLWNPTRIEVPVGFVLKSFSKTRDAGFLMGLEKNDRSTWLFLKTDSSGLMGNCSTFPAKIGHESKLSLPHTPENITAGTPIVQFSSPASALKPMLLTQAFTCKDNICQTPPPTDSCNPGFIKILRSSYYASGVYSGIMVKDKIFTYGMRQDNFSSEDYVRTATLEKYDRNGIFEKGIYAFIDSTTAYPQLWKTGEDSILMQSIFVKNDTLHYLISCFDADFNIYWNTTIKTQYRPNGYTLAPVVYDAVKDAAGNFYLIVTENNLGIPAIVGAIKLNPAGQMQWSSSYNIMGRGGGTSKGTITPKGLVILTQGTVHGASSLLFNLETGILEKSHSIPDNITSSVWAEPAFLFSYQNGSIFYGSTYQAPQTNRLMVVKLDDEGKPLMMKIFENVDARTEWGSAPGMIDAVTDIYDPVLQKYWEVKIRLNEKLEVVHARRTMSDAYLSPRALMVDPSGSALALGFWFGSFGYDHYLSKYDQAGNNGTCIAEEFAFPGEEMLFTTKSLTTTKSNIEMKETAKANLNFLPQYYGLQVGKELCKSTEPCNALLVTGPATACQTDQHSMLRASRNAGCILPVNWIYDTTAIRVLEETNDILKISFKTPGTHLIIARILTGCEILVDSLLINVSPALNYISLGPDTTLCPGDSLLLNAGAGFSSYKWNTGSTDNSIWVSKPGKYFVSVNNSCGAPLHDTIEVFMPAVPFLSAGRDSSVCVGEKFERLASAGFASYQWKNLVTQTVVSNIRLLSGELKSTTNYAIKAATSLGCTRHDTLTMNAISARPFSLGTNQNLCTGDTATFTSPTGYASYGWNTGSNTNSIKAWQQGQYTLSITDTNGCKTADTVSITNVFQLPLPNLGSDKSICAGSSLALSPGTFARYLWHDGRTTANFTASVIGNYSVQVWDNNGCTASDSMKIPALLPLPSGFLAATDSICQYEKITLQPNGTYKTYLWSTGSRQSTLQVDKPGIYGLTVTDSSNCTGSDSIRVIQKACMEGVYIPTAFTPNNDNLNDVFRPMVFGIVVKFEFSLYNRFGELIYQTKEPGKGWDGRWKSILQPANTYAWVCSYQLEGGEAKVEKGMVVLIR
jgi:gliding motility-associated-like protein